MRSRLPCPAGLAGTRTCTSPRPHLSSTLPAWPCSGPSESLELEYKYVVRNSDRTAASWTPGTNYKLAVPANGQAASGARVVVKDSWDGDKHQVKVRRGWAGGAAPGGKMCWRAPSSEGVPQSLGAYSCCCRCCGLPP